MSSKNVRGLNWGKISLEDGKITLIDREKEVFSLPMDKLQNSVVTKQDITLELNTDDIKDDEDLLSEIRLFVPSAIQDKKDDENQESGDQNEEEEQKEDNSFVRKLNQEIIEKAQLGQKAGESIANFPDLQLMVPRGKYTIDFYTTAIRFHGTSYNYLIEYKNIARSFLLPHADDIHVSFVISLIKPIKQGNTIHPFIVINFKKSNECSKQLNITEEDKQKYEWNIEDITEPMEGATNEVFASLFKQIIKVNIFIPGSFKSVDQIQSVSCSVKTNAGYLFPLQKSIVFINKPVIYIPHGEIEIIEFDRISQGQRMFDIKVITRKRIEHTFVGFEKKELSNLMAHFKNRNLKVRTTEQYAEDDAAGLLRAPRGEGKREIKHQAVHLENNDEDDEDDSDFEGGAGEEEEEEDDFDDESESGMAKMVEESDSEMKEKKKKKSKKSNSDDDDDE